MKDAQELHGIVTGIFFARGFGFIQATDDDATSYFFHAHEARDFERINVDDNVVFFPEDHERGPRALRVRKAAA